MIYGQLVALREPCPTSVEVKTPQLLDPWSAWFRNYPRLDGNFNAREPYTNLVGYFRP